MSNSNEPSSQKSTLGSHLAGLRSAAGLSLRQVEEATNREVSNAYLSQLEKDKISKPSPNILHALALVYKTSYEDLMERAGHLLPGHGATSSNRQARVTICAINDLTPEEEKALMAYLAFFREQKREQPKGTLTQGDKMQS